MLGLGSLLSAIRLPPGRTPIVSAVTPSVGSTVGGTSVAVAGAQFAAGAEVYFDGVLATSITVVSADQITCTTPAGSAGGADVKVVNPDGREGTRAAGFTYEAAPAPQVYSVWPDTGPEEGGTEVEVNGDSFGPGAEVYFDGVLATDIVFVSSVKLTCTTPAGTAGGADVKVVNPDAQEDTLVDGFTYGGDAPVLTSSNYTQGDTVGGGLSIVLTGSGFTDGVPYVDGVAIGGGSYTVDSDAQITFTLPAHAAGNVDITVVGPGGTSNALSFEYWDPTQITGVDVVLDADIGVTPTGVGNEVDTWTDRVASVAFAQAAAPPDEIAAVFGTLPGIRFSPNDFLTTGGGTPRALASGTSIFAVAKWTATDSAASGGTANLNAPLTIIGETGGSAWFGFGASAGSVHYQAYDDAGGASYATVRGSGLNDGDPRLIGITHDAGTGDRKVYVGATQQGSTDTPAAYSVLYQTYDTVGAGYTGIDGFDGDLGAVVVVDGVISGGDLTKLNKWAQQRWGTP